MINITTGLDFLKNLQTCRTAYSNGGN